jgi:ECF transporter S component (folate family)
MSSQNFNVRVFRSLRIMIVAAILAAMSIIFGKYLKIPVGDVIRISFENLPLIMAGIFFGPAVGLVTGVVADVTGCLMAGYAINPVITAGAAVIGLVSGLVSHYIIKKPLWLKVASSVAASHILGSVIVKTIGLSAWYNMPFITLMLWRLLTYTCIGAAEFTIIFLLLRSKAVSSQLERLVRKK